jgi:hypothetical protein
MISLLARLLCVLMVWFGVESERERIWGCIFVLEVVEFVIEGVSFWITRVVKTISSISTYWT